MFVWSASGANHILFSMGFDVSEPDIIRDLQLGRESAIKRIHCLYFNSLCYYANQLIDDKDESQDITAESFLVFWNRRNDFNGLSEIKAFLFRVVRNKCIDFIRKEKSRHQQQKELTYLAGINESPDNSALITSHFLQLIHQEIENLPPQCKAVLKSIFLDGKSTMDVARDLSISPQTVLNQKSKALRIIRLKLLEKGVVASTCLIAAVLSGSHLVH